MLSAICIVWLLGALSAPKFLIVIGWLNLAINLVYFGIKLNDK